MNAAVIRPGQAAQHVVPAELADAAAQAQRQGHGAGRGHYRGYVFRHPRSAAPPPARRAVPLRPRQPPAGAPQAGPGHEPEPGLALQRAGLGTPDDVDAQQRLLQVLTHAEAGLGGHGGEGEDDARQGRRMARLRCTPGCPPRPGPAPLDWLQHSGLPGADRLCGLRAGLAGAEAARVAMQVLLGAIAAAGASAAKGAGTPGGAPGIAELFLAIQKRYLQCRGQPGEPAALAGIRQLLLEVAAPGPRRLPASEAQQNAHVLAPVMALNLLRPRTATQRRGAASRLELLGAAALAQRGGLSGER